MECAEILISATSADQLGCPFRVIRVVLTGGRQLPVFPNKQTFSVFAGMSQTCQKRSYGKSNKTKALGWEWREESP
jgi:hypothetical protein